MDKRRTGWVEGWIGEEGMDGSGVDGRRGAGWGQRWELEGGEWEEDMNGGVKGDG